MIMINKLLIKKTKIIYKITQSIFKKKVQINYRTLLFNCKTYQSIIYIYKNNQK